MSYPVPITQLNKHNFSSPDEFGIPDIIWFLLWTFSVSLFKANAFLGHNLNHSFMSSAILSVFTFPLLWTRLFVLRIFYSPWVANGTTVMLLDMFFCFLFLLYIDTKILNTIQIGFILGNKALLCTCIQRCLISSVYFFVF